MMLHTKAGITTFIGLLVLICQNPVLSQDKLVVLNSGISVASGMIGIGGEYFTGEQVSIFGGLGFLIGSDDKSYLGWGVGMKYYFRDDILQSGRGMYIGAAYSPVSHESEFVGGNEVRAETLAGPSLFIGYRLAFGASGAFVLTLGGGVGYVVGMSDFWKNQGTSQFVFVPDLTIGFRF